jgi:hypothetical protein
MVPQAVQLMRHRWSDNTSAAGKHKHTQSTGDTPRRWQSLTKQEKGRNPSVMYFRYQAAQILAPWALFLVIEQVSTTYSYEVLTTQSL